jgi:hypothetical protein
MHYQATIYLIRYDEHVLFTRLRINPLLLSVKRI